MNVVTLLNSSSGGAWSVPLARELARRGHDSHIVVPREGNDDIAHAVDASTPIVRLLRPGLASLPANARLVRRHLRRTAADVCVYHLYRSAVVARLASSGLDLARCHVVPGPLFLEAPLVRALERRAHRGDDLIIAGCEATESHYVDLGRHTGTVTIPYGVDLAHHTPVTAAQRRYSRRRLALGADDFVVTMVSWFYRPKRLAFAGRGIKGHEWLLEAWRRARQQSPAFRSRAVLVVGGAGFQPSDTHYYRSVVELARELGLGTSVRFLGAVDEAASVLAAADVNVTPSLSENHGGVAEPALMGVPSIASAVGGLPDLVVDGRTGWLVDPEAHDELALTLVDAHESWRRGDLRPLGREARTVAVALLDRDANARAMADAVECIGDSGTADS